MRNSRLGLAIALFAWCGVAAADGGRLRAQKDAGAFRLAIFTQPDPLVAGPADVSVLVQDRESGDPLLDAEVRLEFSGPGGAAMAVPATRHSGNRLFYGARVELAPGTWTATARVHASSGGAVAELRVPFDVAEASTGGFTPWPYLAVPPFAVGLFAMNRRLRRKTAAAAVLGYGETHAGVLSDKAALADLSRVLDDTCGRKERDRE